MIVDKNVAFLINILSFLLPLRLFSYSSDRKIMSIIVKNTQSDEIWLISKGAESSIIPRCRIDSKKDEILCQTTLKHINDYAMVSTKCKFITCCKFDFLKVTVILKVFFETYIRF